MVDAQERLFLVVDPLRVDHQVGPRAAAAEQGGDASGSERLHRVVPAGGRAGRIDREVERIFGRWAVAVAGAAEMRFGGAEGARHFEAPAVRVEGADMSTHAVEQVDQHESQRTAADDQGPRLGGRTAPCAEAAFEAVDGAGQRFRHGGHHGFEAGGPRVHAALRDGFGDQQVVGESAVQVDEVAAEVLAFVPARLALAAGGAVGDDDGVSFGVKGPGPGPDDGSGDLVAEGRRQGQHGRMAAAAVDLDVGAAGGRGIDPDQQFAGAWLGHRQPPQLDAPGAGEKGLGLVFRDHAFRGAAGPSAPLAAGTGRRLRRRGPVAGGGLPAATDRVRRQASCRAPVSVPRASPSRRRSPGART